MVHYWFAEGEGSIQGQKQRSNNHFQNKCCTVISYKLLSENNFSFQIITALTLTCAVVGPPEQCFVVSRTQVDGKNQWVARGFDQVSVNLY